MATNKPTVIKSVRNSDHHHLVPRAPLTDSARRLARALLAGERPWVDEAMVIHYGDGQGCCGKSHEA